MAEIELSSRLCTEDGAVFMKAKLAPGSESGDTPPVIFLLPAPIAPTCGAAQ